VKVNVNKNNEKLLQAVLVEFSKTDFNVFVNSYTSASDLAEVNIEIEGAELKALLQIHKKPYYSKPISEMSYTDTISEPEKYIIKKVEVLDSRLIVKDDVLDISHHRLLAAHDEQLYKQAHE
jgi:hypothetical protein